MTRYHVAAERYGFRKDSLPPPTFEGRVNECSPERMLAMPGDENSDGVRRPLEVLKYIGRFVPPCILLNIL